MLIKIPSKGISVNFEVLMFSNITPFMRFSAKNSLTWLFQINSIFEDARNEVQNLISHDGTLLTSTEFDALLESERGLENDGKWFVAQINDRLQKLSRKVDSRIESAFDEISENFSEIYA